MENKFYLPDNKGQKLSVIIDKPLRKGKFSTVILLHGFRGYKEEPHIEILAKDLVRYGFVSVRFDASGLGESEGSWTKAYKVPSYLSDMESVYEYLKQQSFIDVERIGVWGHSMGGMVSIIFAVKHPEIKAVCSVSPPLTLVNIPHVSDDLRKLRTSFWRFISLIVNNTMVKKLFNFLVDSENYNVLNYVGDLRRPLLVICGTDDHLVPSKETKLIYERARSPKIIEEIVGMGHEYKNDSKLVKYVNRNKIIPFFKKYLV